METYFLTADRMGEFVSHLAKFGRIYRYEKTESGARLKAIAETEYAKYAFPEIRSAEPAKFLFMKAKRKLAEYFNPKWRKTEIKEEPKVVIGMKSCDISAIKIWDTVFRDDPDYKDPFYTTARENTLLVGSDCTTSGENCFCTLLGNNPYPKEGEYDLNISPVDNGFVVYVGSDKGKKAMAGLTLQTTPSDLTKLIELRRDNVFNQVRDGNKKNETKKQYRELVEKNPESPAFTKHGETCVACAACTYVCPTCFCFQIYDKPTEEGNSERFLVLDSCKYPRFSFMAGGMNPRGRLVERFKHRYNHKFFHYHWRYNVYACTGCGRCIENCMGKIDMRETLKDIEKQ